MPKIVVNACYGGFGLSDEAVMRYAKLAMINLIRVEGEIKSICHYYKDVVSDDNYFSPHDLERDDPILIQVVEEMGEAANGDMSELRIANVPDDVIWYIDEYDGIETVSEVHRTW
jgi:hypothetical protein